MFSPSTLLRCSQTASARSLYTTSTTLRRNFHATQQRGDRSFTNLLADETPPPVQVASMGEDGIHLVDGLKITGPVVFLEGKVFLWNVPEVKPGKDGWKGWTEEHLALFDVVIPTPEIMLLGTGKRILQPPPFIRKFLNERGIQLDVLDTRNACATYNLLAEEGRRVAAALLPFSSRTWPSAPSPTASTNSPSPPSSS